MAVTLGIRSAADGCPVRTVRTSVGMMGRRPEQWPMSHERVEEGMGVESVLRRGGIHRDGAALRRKGRAAELLGLQNWLHAYCLFFHSGENL